MSKEKNDRGIGDNSLEENNLTLLEGAQKVISKIIAGVLEKDLYYDLAKDHHENARVATRVADRHESLSALKECIEWREEPINILKKFHYASKNNGSLYAHEFKALRDAYGQEVVDHFRKTVREESF
tara:strand:- start:606 stop:986 length:381 start_codon:yes stop_codon:yes gene_type:complete